MGHGLMENRHGFWLTPCLTFADGHAERVAALHMIEPRADRKQSHSVPTRLMTRRTSRVTLDEGDAARGAEHHGRRSAIDGRTNAAQRLCCQSAYSQRIEEAFGWIKTVAGQAKTKLGGRDRIGGGLHLQCHRIQFLVRLPKLLTVPT